MGNVVLNRSLFIGNIALVLGLAGMFIYAEYNSSDKDKDKEEGISIESSTNEVQIDSGAKTLPKDANNRQSILAYVTSYVQNTGQKLHKYSEVKEEVTDGYYIYAVHVESTGKKNSFISKGKKIEVRDNMLTSFEGYTSESAFIDEGNTGLLVIQYINGSASSATFNKLNINYNQLLTDLDMVEIPDYVSLGNEQSGKDKELKDLKASEWEGLAKVTSDEITKKEMAPVFVVPVTDLSLNRDLTGSFYYIIVGKLAAMSENSLTLDTYLGKRVTVDFTVDYKEEDLGSPVWIHAIVQDGKLISSEIQSFPGVSNSVMSEGILNYVLNTSSSNQ